MEKWHKEIDKVQGNVQENSEGIGVPHHRFTSNHYDTYSIHQKAPEYRYSWTNINKPKWCQLSFGS